MPFVPTYFPRGAPGGGGGGGGGTDQNYLLSEASTAGSTASTVSAWVQNGDDIDITMKGAGTAFALPSDGDFVEWLLRDSSGNVAEFELEDLFSAVFRMRKKLPVGVTIGICVTAGGMAIAGAGAMWALRYNAAGNRAVDSEHAGTSWSGVTQATNTDGTTRMALGGWTQSNGISGARNSCTPADGSGRPATATNTTTAPGLSNVEIDGKFTHVAIVVMRTDTTGVNGPVVTCGAQTSGYPQQRVTGRRDIWESDHTTVTGIITKIAVIGNSQAGTGGGVDTVRGLGGSGDDVVPASLDFEDINLGNLANWPASCAGRPYLSDELIAQVGWVSGWCEWSGNNNMAFNPPAAWRTAFAALLESVIARDDGDPQVVALLVSENDIADAAEAALFEDSLRDVIRAVRYEWPGARVLVVECSDANTGNPTYSERDTARAHQATDVAEVADCELVSAVGADLFDDVHYSTGPGNGHATMMARLGALLVA